VLTKQRQNRYKSYVGDLNSKPVAETLDVLGHPCPYPIVLIKKEMEKIPIGAVLKILCDSQITVEEVIPHYCEKKGYAFKSVKLEGEGHWEVYLEKK
jgi:tRNA 2-thiouridine synthesizing protein A